MSGFDYASVRARLGKMATARWPADRLRVIVDEHERETSFAAMGRQLRVSKNACISQAHRMGLPNRNKSDSVARANAKRTRRQWSTAHPAPRPPEPPKLSVLDRRHARRAEVRAALALGALHIGRISDLAATQCKWPVGDPKSADFGFCGRLKVGSGPYCACHRAASVDRAATTQSHHGGIERLAILAQPRRTGASKMTGAWA